MAAETTFHVSLGDPQATFSSPTGTKVLVARVLGRTNANGTERVFLDRVVHGPGAAFVGWQASGAVSTILSRPCGG